MYVAIYLLFIICKKFQNKHYYFYWNRYRDKLKKLNNSLLADCQKALNMMNNIINCMKP